MDFKPYSRRLLICTTGIPHPEQGAGIVILFEYVRHFKKMGFEILHWIAVPNQPDIEQKLTEYRQAIGADEHFQTLLWQTPDWYQPRSHRQIYKSIQTVALPESIRHRLKSFQPHAVFSFDIAAASLIKGVAAAPHVVWLGDLHFQSFWYHALYAFKEDFRNCVRLPFAWINQFHWRHFYKKALHDATFIVASSKASEHVLRQLRLESTYMPYPWPDKAVPSSSKKVTLSRDPHFLFMGNLAGLGSRSALQILFYEIYPRLLKIWGTHGFRIDLCGINTIPAWTKDALRERPEIHFLGFVDDLDSLMRQCHAVIAPIDVPVGNRTRILTALSAGVPVVAHSSTALGNPDLVDGKTCFLADNAEAFCHKMQELYENATTRNSLSENARRMYEKTFYPTEAAGGMEKVLLKVL